MIAKDIVRIKLLNLFSMLLIDEFDVATVSAREASFLASSNRIRLRDDSPSSRVLPSSNSSEAAAPMLRRGRATGGGGGGVGCCSLVVRGGAGVAAPLE